ncbi:MAG: phosphoribosylformylglycinamidine synthase subunit PurQ, partial [Vulcanococcus sp.]
MTLGVVVFPGSNCDRDVQWAAQGCLGIETRFLWHEERDLSGLDAVVIPGGFSYGDYLRCGAIARFAPVLEEVAAFAKRGGRVLGICNGFQVLTEMGLLPGALTRNQKLHFICEPTDLRVEPGQCSWLQGYSSGEVVNFPIAHGEGRYQAD